MQSRVEVNLQKRATESQCYRGRRLYDLNKIPRGLNTDKLLGIIRKIGPLIPSNRMKFCTELEENDEAEDFAANIRSFRSIFICDKFFVRKFANSSRSKILGSKQCVEIFG